MTLNLAELRTRYAAMNSEQLLLIQEVDLLPEARACFEGELRRRGLTLVDCARARAELRREIQQGVEQRIAGHRRGARLKVGVMLAVAAFILLPTVAWLWIVGRREDAAGALSATFAAVILYTLFQVIQHVLYKRITYKGGGSPK